MLCCEPIGMSHQTKTVWVYPNAGVPTEIPKVLRLLSIRTPRKVGLEIQQCQPFNCGLTKKGGRKQSRPTMNKPPTFKGLNIWILTIIPTKGRGLLIRVWVSGLFRSPKHSTEVMLKTPMLRLGSTHLSFGV